MVSAEAKAILLDIIRDQPDVEPIEDVLEAEVRPNGDIVFIGKNGWKLVGFKITDEEIFSRLLNSPQQSIKAEVSLAQVDEGIIFSGLPEDQEALDQAISELSPELLQSQIEPIVQPIIDLVQSAKSYDEILEGLAQRFPEMDDRELERYLSCAIFVTEVWGRLNANQP